MRAGGEGHPWLILLVRAHCQVTYLHFHHRHRRHRQKDWGEGGLLNGTGPLSPSYGRGGGGIRSNVTCTVLLRISEVASHFTPICGGSSRAKRCCLPWRDTRAHSHTLTHRHAHRTGPAKDTNRLLPPPPVSRRTHTHARTQQNSYFIFSARMTRFPCLSS